MKNIFAISGCLLFLSIASTSFSQKKVTVLGSSTAFGTGATPGFGWVDLLTASFNKNKTDGVDTVVDNRALGGYTTYHSMPTGNFVPNRPSPDETRNVTFVLNNAPRPDIVIINYPTNDIASAYSPKEMMDNLRLMFKTLNDNGIRTFITTSQPRELSDEQRTILKQLVDSIQSTFGVYSINFWDDIVSQDGLNHIRDEVSAGDGTHVNNLGHQLLFERVVAKNIFGEINNSPLPVTLKNWQVSIENSLVKLNWKTGFEELGTSFEIQRSSNGTTFQTVFLINGTGHDASYSWTDASPLNGKSFYRLKIIESSKVSFSLVIPIINHQLGVISSFYADASQLHLQFNSNRTQSASLTIINYSGGIVKKQTLASGVTSITIPITVLPSGNYILKITTVNGLSWVERFTKLK